MLPRSIATLACLTLALIAACPSAASAAPGEYTVEVCTASSNTGGGTPTLLPGEKVEGSGLLYREHTPDSLSLVPCNEGRVVLRSPLGGHVPQAGSQLWLLIAAKDTRIEQLRFGQSFSRQAFNAGGGRTLPSFIEWFERVGGVRVAKYREDGALFFPTEGLATGDIQSSSAGFEMFCSDEDAGDCGPGEFTVTASNIRAEVLDGFLPGVSEPELATRTLRGTANVGFKAVDRGSGIAKVEMLLDGKSVASTSDDNGGKCVTPYKFMQPCKLEVESSFPLDTTALPEGRHEIAILATDASGLTRESPPLTVLVHNAPTNVERPVIQGAAHVGVKLKATPGQWAGAPTGFAFRWFRCPAGVRGEEDVQACRAIPGATGTEYTTGKDDLGQRDLVEVVATNSSGSEARLSFPTDVVDQAGSGAGSAADKPVLTHLRLLRKRFRVGSTLSKKGKRASVVAFTCNKAGQVSIVIRRLRGHRKPKPMGKLVAPVKPGRSRVLLSGEIGRRRLRPGPYEVSVRVTDGKGIASDPARTRFRIIPG